MVITPAKQFLHSKVSYKKDGQRARNAPEPSASVFTSIALYGGRKMLLNQSDLYIYELVVLPLYDISFQGNCIYNNSNNNNISPSVKVSYRNYVLE